MDDERRPPIVFYHGDQDGFCAAWVLSYGLPADTEFVPVQHQTEPLDFAERDVYILDLVFPYQWQAAICAEAERVVCVDHHRTAKDTIRRIEAEFPEGCRGGLGERRIVNVLQEKKSACRLAWEVGHDLGIIPHLGTPWSYSGPQISRDEPPWVVKYVEDRDLWAWGLVMSREVNAAIRTWPLELAAWDTNSRRGQQSWETWGRAVLSREKQIVEQHVRHHGWVVLAGERVPITNCTVNVASEIGEALSGLERPGKKGEPEPVPFAASYVVYSDLTVIVQLRSREGGADVSKIASRYRGGGHPRAAGFRAPLDALAAAIRAAAAEGAE